MTTFKMLLVISAVTVVLAAPATAQQGIFIPNGSLLMVDSSGHARIAEAGNMARGMMRRSGRPVGAGLILYNDGRRLYSMTDKKMAGGKMLSDMLLENFQTDPNRASHGG
jgi:hypothetical protein